jgi:hypothetical protein
MKMTNAAALRVVIKVAILYRPSFLPSFVVRADKERRNKAPNMKQQQI